MQYADINTSCIHNNEKVKITNFYIKIYFFKLIKLAFSIYGTTGKHNVSEAYCRQRHNEARRGLSATVELVVMVCCSCMNDMSRVMEITTAVSGRHA